MEELSPCLLNTVLKETLGRQDVITRKAHVHITLTGLTEENRGRLFLAGFLSEEPISLTVDRMRFKQEGLMITTDQPVAAGMNVTLTLDSQDFLVGRMRISRRGSESSEDAVSWTYRVQIPTEMLVNIEKRRKSFG